MKLKKLKETTKVRIESKGEYLLLMELAEKSGYKWNSGDLPTVFNYDDYYLNSKTIVMNHDKTMNVEYSCDLDTVSIKKVIKFEVGDKVRIREDLDEFDKNKSPSIVPHMLNYAGEICKITGIYRNNKTKQYTLESAYYRWLKEWIEPVLTTEEEKVGEITVGDMVRVVNTGALYSTNIRKVKEMTNDKNVLVRYAYGDDKGFYPESERNELDCEYKVIEISDDFLLIEKKHGEVLLIEKRGVKKC